ncbi:MAG: NAD(P)-dependent oxidoreductase [Zoogloeaceae bacterium]|nr:NAD(P)-dependent oxidoreductase [Zoogloeaceae bacterium]
MRVGWIGLGAMGRPMAGHLLAAGHEVAVWARNPAASAPLADQGFVVSSSPAELAARSDVVVTIVTSSADVEGLAFGPAGLAAGLPPGGVHVDMSTIAPAMARRLAARYADRGLGWVDAPVSGGETGARNATLAIMAGAQAEVLERVRPLLRALGKSLVHVGPPGAGQVAKACNQLIMVAAIEACAEAMSLAQANGVDLAAVRTALLGGSAASRVLEVMGDRMVRRDFAPGIESRLHHKDFGLVLQDAVALGCPLPVAAQVWQQLNALMGLGGGRDDTASLLRVLEAESREQP